LILFFEVGDLCRDFLLGGLIRDTFASWLTSIEARQLAHPFPMRSKIFSRLGPIPTRLPQLHRISSRWSSTSTSGSKLPEQKQDDSNLVDVEALLSKPTWSVQSLVPPTEMFSKEPPVSKEKLRHLLRLSALPEPKDEEEESRLMQDLASQLHFVQEIQKVDTRGVEPLRAIHDETVQAEQEAELTVEKLQEAFSREEVLGKYHQRIRRRKDTNVVDENRPPGWKPLEHAKRRVGEYFVVDKSKT